MKCFTGLSRFCWLQVIQLKTKLRSFTCYRNWPEPEGTKIGYYKSMSTLTIPDDAPLCRAFQTSLIVGLVPDAQVTEQDL